MSSNPVDPAHAHPLDDCDEDECYKTMMAERTTLITARREAEDNLVKTIIQLSVALVAVLAGFITQADFSLSKLAAILLSTAVVLFGLAVLFGLTEHLFSSKAYQAQQEMVEQYYQKKIHVFNEPPQNKYVRRCQIATYSCFVVALAALSVLAKMQSWEKSNAKQRATTSTSTSATATTSSSGTARR